MPDPRSYHQNCSLAHVLDLVGERWTLLIVRELARGPKRFSHLETGLPGIGANLLATRLKRLEANGIAERAELAPGVPGYGLSPHGESLVDAMEDLMLWGFGALDSPDPDRQTRAVWAAMGMRIWMDRSATRPPEGLYAFAVGEERFWIRVGHERSQLRDGEPPYPADATLVVGQQDFFFLATGHRDLDDLDAEMTGDAGRLTRVLETFRLPPNPKLTPSGPARSR